MYMSGRVMCIMAYLLGGGGGATGILGGGGQMPPCAPPGYPTHNQRNGSRVSH